MVVDGFTKYAHFIPPQHPFTAHHVVLAVLSHVVKLHGLPSSIVSDHDKILQALLERPLSSSRHEYILSSPNGWTDIASESMPGNVFELNNSEFSEEVEVLVAIS